MPRLSEREIEQTARATLDFYETHAQAFWEGTCDHDVSQNLDALIGALRGAPPYTVLDLGCGPGRDLIALTERGCRAVGIEGASAFVRMARESSACEVWQQSFLDLDLPAGGFDGVFANASLFHVPAQSLPDVLGRLWACLVPGGVLFSSNPRGENQEGWSGGRYAVFHDWEAWRRFCLAAGFEEIGHYYRPPGRPRSQQPWLASLWRRPEKSKEESEWDPAERTNSVPAISSKR